MTRTRRGARSVVGCYVHKSVSYDWSWQPLGFQCTYDNGKTETSLWF